MDRTDTGVSYMGIMDRGFVGLERTEEPDDAKMSRREGQRVAGEEREIGLSLDPHGNKNR